MAVKPAVLGLGLFILGAIVVGASEAGGGERAPHGPIPVPTTDPHFVIVNAKICDCWVALNQIDNAAALRLCVAETLHPSVQWPPIEGDDATVKKVWAILSTQVGAFMASADKAAWCQPGGGDDPQVNPLDVLDELQHDSPTDGGFYLIGSDPELGPDQKDNFSRIVKAALNNAVPGAGNNANMRKEYIHCITQGDRWNYPLYASSSFSSAYPSYYGVNGMGLRRAFYPYHEQAALAVAENRMPTRAITESGTKISGIGNRFGLIWLPPLDKSQIAQGVFTCGQHEWADGSSAINPPPEFLALVGG